MSHPRPTLCSEYKPLTRPLWVKYDPTDEMERLVGLILSIRDQSKRRVNKTEILETEDGWCRNKIGDGRQYNRDRKDEVNHTLDNETDSKVPGRIVTYS